MKKYCCSDWDENIEKVNGQIVLQSLRAGRDLFNGKPFKFCPWCGSTIEEQRTNLPSYEDVRGILKDEA